MNITYIGKTKMPLQVAPKHTHYLWEFILNISGSGTMQIGELNFNFKPGTITICPPEVPHIKHAVTEFEDIYFHFAGPPTVDCNKIYYDDSLKRIEQLMLMMYNIYFAGEKNATNICDCFLVTIFEILRGQTTDMHDMRSEKLKQIIIERFNDPDFHIDTAMNAFLIGKDHLRRLFKKNYGVNPIEYLTELRVKNSKQLLMQKNISGLSVAEISYQSGFYDQQYFTRVFKKFTGSTPSEWIKNK